MAPHMSRDVEDARHWLTLDKLRRIFAEQNNVVAVRETVLKPAGRHFADCELQVFLIAKQSAYQATVGLTTNSGKLKIYMRSTSEKRVTGGQWQRLFVSVADAVLADTHCIRHAR